MNVQVTPAEMEVLARMMSMGIFVSVIVAGLACLVKEVCIISFFLLSKSPF